VFANRRNEKCLRQRRADAVYEVVIMEHARSVPEPFRAGALGDAPTLTPPVSVGPPAMIMVGYYDHRSGQSSETPPSGPLPVVAPIEHVRTLSPRIPVPAHAPAPAAQEIPASVRPAVPAMVRPEIPATVRPEIPATVRPEIPPTARAEIPATAWPEMAVGPGRTMVLPAPARPAAPEPPTPRAPRRRPAVAFLVAVALVLLSREAVAPTMIRWIPAPASPHGGRLSLPLAPVRRSPSPVATEAPRRPLAPPAGPDESPIGAAPSAGPRYRVRGVVPPDTLNLRNAPSATSAIAGTIAADGRGVVATGRRQRVGATPWWEVTYRGERGWVNARFLAAEPTAVVPRPTRPGS
jgi:hypothetical protein